MTTDNNARSGQDHPRALLDWEIVRAIRANTQASNSELARRYGVDRKTIRLVRANMTWRDPAYVPAPEVVDRRKAKPAEQERARREAAEDSA